MANTTEASSRANVSGLKKLSVLLVGEGISALGTKVTGIAMPLAAIEMFNASSWQVGLLASLVLLPNIALGIPVGAWIDQARPRRVMLVSDCTRLLFMGSIPLAYSIHAITFVHLCIVAFLVGCMTVFYETAVTCYVPWLVGRDLIIVARSRQSTVEYLAEVGGQPLGGVLVAAIGGAWTVITDSVSYLISFLCLRTLPDMPPVAPRNNHAGLIKSTAEGLRFSWKNKVNRYLMIEAAHYNLAYRAFLVCFMIYTVRTMHWNTGYLGISLAALSIGAVIGSAIAPTISRRFGVGRTLVGALVVGDLGPIVIPVINIKTLMGITIVISAFLLMGAGSLVSAVLSSSLNRSITPETIYGRVVGARSVVTRGGSALGGIVGGVLISLVGTRSALTICIIGMVSAAMWVVRRDIARTHSLPEWSK